MRNVSLGSDIPSLTEVIAWSPQRKALLLEHYGAPQGGTFASRAFYWESSCPEGPLPPRRCLVRQPRERPGLEPARRAPDQHVRQGLGDRQAGVRISHMNSPDGFTSRKTCRPSGVTMKSKAP